MPAPQSRLLGHRPPAGACPARRGGHSLLKRSPLPSRETETQRGKGCSRPGRLPPPCRPGRPRRGLLRGSTRPCSRCLLPALCGGHGAAPLFSPLLSSRAPPSCGSQQGFGFSSGKQVSIEFYFLLPRIRCCWTKPRSLALPLPPASTGTAPSRPRAGRPARPGMWSPGTGPRRSGT